MKKNIPLFEFVIDDTESSGVKAISIVSNPAFQNKLIAFAAVKPQFVLLADAKGKKRKVAGLALIPDVPVFRIDDVTGMEYNGFFSKETIEKIVEKFHDEMNNNKVNLNHDENKSIDAILIEDYIVDTPQRAEDLKLKGITHENIIGSWYVCYKIKNEQVFESIIKNQNEGNPTGFSVECFLNTILVEMNKVINKNNLKKVMKKNNKNLLEKIIEIFSKEEFDRVLVPELAITLEVGKPGEVVNQVITDEKGTETLVPSGPGEYNTDSGVIVVDETSKLVEVRPLPEQPQPIPAAEVSPDSGATETMKAYPWDQCISDQLGAGYSQEAADKICGWIKANNSSQEGLTDEILQSILTPDEYACKKKKLDDDSIKLDDEEVLVDPVAEVSPDMMPPDGTDPNAPPAPDVKSKTIGEIVGDNDGEYWVKVVVSGGLVTEAEVSSETDLLKTSLEEVKKENSELKDKLKEPIGEPILAPEPQKKDWNKMSAYEKALAKARM